MSLTPTFIIDPYLFPADFACFFQRELGDGGTDQLIDERAAEDDRANLRRVFGHDLAGG